MGKVSVGLTISLDGFIAGPNDGPRGPLGESSERFFVCTPAATPIQVVGDRDGVLAAERRAPSGGRQNDGGVRDGTEEFDITNGWGGKPPLGLSLS